MKKSDFFVIPIIYGIALFFGYSTMQLPPEAQTYPAVLISAILVLNTLYLAKVLYVYSRERRLTDDFEHLYDGFLPRQFFFVVGSTFGYIALIYGAGYYLASVVFMVLSLLFFRIRLQWIVLIIAVLMTVIYLVFSMFLHVPLPVGMLFD